MQLERDLFAQGAPAILAYDEVGRGALAGPVMVGVALLLPSSGEPPAGLADSKELSLKHRDHLVQPILSWCTVTTGQASAAEIDEYGILAALRASAERATTALRALVAIDPLAVAIVDGSYDWLRRPVRYASDVDALSFERVIVRPKADRDCASVAAASVVAKVRRDELMGEIAKQYPEYDWAKNKGYATAQHRSLIGEHGTCELHRRSWRLT